MQDTDFSELISRWEDAAAQLEQVKESLHEILSLSDGADGRPGRQADALREKEDRLENVLAEAQRVTQALRIYGHHEDTAAVLPQLRELLSSLRENALSLESSWEGAASNAFVAFITGLASQTENALLRAGEARPAAREEPPIREIFSCAPGPDPGKTIRLIQGNLAKAEGEYDVVVCSAFKGDYVPLKNTLIGALQAHRGVSVHALSLAPELDFRSMGCWLSRETGGSFRRIACLELLDYRNRHSQRMDHSRLLKSAFSTLSFLIAQADAQGIPVRRIALPVLGAGNQGLGMEYIVPPLFAQCTALLSTISDLETIDFYEINPGRLEQLAQIMNRLLASIGRKPSHVFVSYSTKQSEMAHFMSRSLESSGIPTWIAPESIPTGSNYVKEITTAIHASRLLLLLLTEDAQRSNWVPNEVSSAVGAGKTLVPVQPYPFTPSPEFQFMLERAQILPLWRFEEAERFEQVVSAVWSMIRS